MFRPKKTDDSKFIEQKDLDRLPYVCIATSSYHIRLQIHKSHSLHTKNEWRTQHAAMMPLKETAKRIFISKCVS